MKSINKSAYFMLDNIKFDLKYISDAEMDSMTKDTETGQPREVFGYPSYITDSGRLWPLSVDSIEVIYGK